VGKEPAPSWRPVVHGAETVVQSGDGRDVMTRPVGATKVSSSLAFPFMDQPELCSR
jgi:hypothetical protein